MMTASRHGSNVTLDASNFNAAMRQLSKLTGLSMEKVIRGELKKILETTVSRTKAAKSKLIRERFTYREGQKPSERLIGRVTIAGRRRNVASIKPTIKRGGQTVRNPDWVLLQKKLKEELKHALEMRGLSKATWLKQARDLRINLQVPSYVEKAYKHIGTAAAKTWGKVTKRKPYVITIKNAARVPMVRQVYGYGAFKRAFNGRQKFFEKNLATGVFKSSARMTEKYGFWSKTCKLNKAGTVDAVAVLYGRRTKRARLGLAN